MSWHTRYLCARSIHPSIEDEDEAYRGLAKAPGYQFGWESWRGVWGSDELRNRGSKFLVQLGTSDRHVYPKEVEEFRVELESIGAAAHEISQALEIEEEGFLFRVRNALSACTHAKENGWAISIS